MNNGLRGVLAIFPAILIMLIIGVVFLIRVKTVEDGEAGMKIRFGKINEQALDTGWHFYVPVTSNIEIWNVKLREIKETANVPSSEGMISTVEISLIFRVDKENVVKVRKTIGAGYLETVVKPYFRESIRSIISGYKVKALFSNKGRTEITAAMKAYLETKLSEKGIYVKDVLLRDVTLPRAFKESIERKLQAEQRALQKQFELEAAVKDAEIEVARAKGVAESNKIIANSISKNYIRYLWVKGLNDGSSEVIYVATEAGIPIMEAGARLNIE